MEPGLVPESLLPLLRLQLMEEARKEMVHRNTQTPRRAGTAWGSGVIQVAAADMSPTAKTARTQEAEEELHKQACRWLGIGCARQSGYEDVGTHGTDFLCWVGKNEGQNKNRASKHHQWRWVLHWFQEFEGQWRFDDTIIYKWGCKTASKEHQWRFCQSYGTMVGSGMKTNNRMTHSVKVWSWSHCQAYFCVDPWARWAAYSESTALSPRILVQPGNFSILRYKHCIYNFHMYILVVVALVNLLEFPLMLLKNLTRRFL